MIYSEFDIDNHHCFINVRNTSLISAALVFISILYHILASTHLSENKIEQHLSIVKNVDTFKQRLKTLCSLAASGLRMYDQCSQCFKTFKLVTNI